MHIKTAHSKTFQNSLKAGKKENKTANQVYNETAMFVCDSCGYRALERSTLLKHIDALHQNPWNPQTQTVQTITEELNRDQIVFGEREEEIEIPEEIDIEFTANVQERECPTPIPESIYICAECNYGCESSKEADVHIQSWHGPDSKDERILRLESELNYEKTQHKDHLEMLEEALIESSKLKTELERLENVINDLK